MRWLPVLLAATVLSGGAVQAALFIEAEDLDGLPYYPFHNLRAEGWYAREANCRGYGTAWGNGKIAGIHATARNRTASLRLQAPLATGRYRVTVRVAGTVMAEKLERDNVLRLQAGSSALDFRWRNAGRRFAWLPMQDLVLEQPAASLSVTGVQFGGGGLGHLNEAQAPSLWLDTIYLTGDPAETEPPTPERERQAKFGASVLPLPKEVRPLWHTRFEPPVPFTASRIALQSADGSPNLFPDGSFELGMNGGWAATNLAYTFCYLFTDDDLDERSPAEGRTSLRVPATASPFSRPFWLEQGGRLTLSLSLRSRVPQTVGVELRAPGSKNALLSLKCPVTEGWQRFAITGDVPTGWVYLRLQNPQLAWVDGIQLERGDLTPFRPRAAVEGGLSTGEIGNVLPDGKRELRLWFHNSAAAPQPARLHYRIVDLWERVVAEGATKPVDVAAGGSVRLPFPLPMAERGIFSACFAVNDRPLPEGELVFVVLPPAPKGAWRHELGANMDPLAPAYALMSRLGFRRQLYCKFTPTMPDRAQPAPGEWKWFDDQAALAGGFGIETIACLWPSRPRPFWGDTTKVPGETMGLTRNTSRSYKKGAAVYPDLAGWREYVRTLVSHYRSPLHLWCVEDETELYFTPRDFAPILQASREAARGVDPAMQVGTSMCPQYQEELLALTGGQVDFMAASSWESSYWEARKIRWLQERTGKPWYCIGVGLADQPGFYHTMPQSRPALKDAATTAQQIAKLCVVQDAKVVGHYTGRLWNNGEHTPRDFPLVDYDGTPLPHGAVYAGLGRLLANAVPAGDVPLSEAQPGGDVGRAFLFEQEGRVHAITWAGAPAGLHGHGVQTPATSHDPVRQLTLRLPRGSVRLTDPFGNDWRDARWEGDRLSIALSPMPVLVWNRSLPRAELERALRGSAFVPDEITGRITVAANPDDPNRLDLLVTLQRPGGGPLPDAVEIGAAPGQLMTDDQWLLAERLRPIRASDWKGNECAVRFATVLTADRLRQPLENAQVYAWALRQGQVVGGIFDTLWVARLDPAGRRALDGDLGEWQGRSAAWLDYSFSWARFGRWLEQVEEGGEYLSEFMSDPDFVDARVGFWCARDGDALTVSTRVYDDQPREGDALILSPGAGPAITVPLAPGKVTLPAGEAQVRRTPDGWACEARMSLKAIGWDGGPLLAMDVRYRDNDIDAGTKTASVLRWAGASHSQPASKEGTIMSLQVDVVRLLPLLVLWAALVCFFPRPASAHWVDDPRLPEWAQRGRIIYLDHTLATEDDFQLVERMKEEGATPFLHAFTPHWPDDPKLVERLERAGIPVDVRVDGSLFFEDDHLDRFASIHGEFRPGGWWYNHAWRTNFDWYRLWPESLLATTRMRNGDEKMAYAGHRVTQRREGSPLAPEHRSVRAKQISWLLTGVDPLLDEPMRPYENRGAKVPAVPYPMLGRYAGLWYDNPSSGPSYDLACRAAWERHFREKFGEPIWDPPSHPDLNVRREWARFWAGAWVDFYRWRKEGQDRLMRDRGRPFCLTAGNFSFISRPHGTVEYYLASKGIVDMPGPSEYRTEFNRGRFHFLVKTMLAATHGRPAGKFYPKDLSIAENLAIGGTTTYRPAEAAFHAANIDLFGRVQPGGRIAILFHLEYNLIESQMVNLQELADQIAALGYPYEVVVEDDLSLGAELARRFPLLVVANTDLTEKQGDGLRRFAEGGGRALIIGDCAVERPGVYDLKSPPAWGPDRSVASLLDGTPAERRVVDARQLLPARDLKAAIDRLGGPGFRLSVPDPDVFLNVLRQPKGDLILAGVVNYSGREKSGLVVHLPADLRASGAGWISRDGGAQILAIRDGRVVLPEVRYGGMLLLGERPSVEPWVQKNARLFPRTALPAGTAMGSALQYSDAYARRMPVEEVPAGRTLCRHCVGAADRGGFLLLDVLAPQAARVGQPVPISIHVLDLGYDYVEYWQLIMEDTQTGKRTVAAIGLPESNPHGEAAKLAGSTLMVSWAPPAAGTYQAHLAYRVVRLTADGEPFLEPENVPAGYSGTTPANLFLKGQPVAKRPYEDRLRGLRIRVE